MIPINRLVALLTPIVFAPLAAAVTGWLGRHFPGLPALDAGQLVALEIAGFTGAAAMAAHWLTGHQKWEARLARLEEAVTPFAESLDPALTPPPLDAAPDLPPGEPTP